MAKPASAELVTSMDFTEGRQGLRIPILGPAEDFRVKDTPLYLARFWVLNGYGKQDGARSKTDLRNFPVLMLEQDGDLPAVTITGAKHIPTAEERSEERRMSYANSEGRGIYKRQIEETRILVPGEGIEPEVFLQVSHAERHRAREGSDGFYDMKFDITHRGEPVLEPPRTGEDHEAYRQAHLAHDQAAHLALSNTVQLLSLPV